MSVVDSSLFPGPAPSTISSVRNQAMPLKNRSFTPATPLFVTIMMAMSLPGRLAYATGSTEGVVGVLQKKYTLTELTADKTQITRDGAQLSLKQAGVYSLPCKNFVVLDNKVEEGRIGKQNVFVSASFTRMHGHVLQSGEKVYVTKIESKPDNKNDILKFTVASVENIDGGDGSERYCGTVSYKLKKGILSEGSPDDIEQIVETVLSPEDSGGDTKQENTASALVSAQPPAPIQRAAAPPPPPPPVAPPLPPLSIGETSSQVLQAYGMPTKIVDLGKKKTFFYKDIKVIFTDDKISDMQPL